MTIERDSFGKNPDTSPERRYTGIQGFDITTVGHLFDPKRTFWMTNELNKEKPRSEWVGVEVYATINRPILSPIGRALRMLPKGVTAQDIYDWQKEFPNTMVTRVHQAFSATRFEAIHRIVLGEQGNGKEHLYQIAWLIGFGSASNMHGVNLITNLRSQGQEAVMNAHTNVVEWFAQSGLLSEVRSKTGGILAENERKYKSPIVSDQRVLYDPKVIVEQILRKYPQVDGLLLGFDHKHQQEDVDIMKLLDNPEITDSIHAIHIADTTKDLNHNEIQIGDKRVGEFIRKVSGTTFPNPVRIAFDYSPNSSFGGMSPDRQLQDIKETIDWIRDIQEGSGDTTPRILKFKPRVAARQKSLEATA